MKNFKNTKRPACEGLLSQTDPTSPSDSLCMSSSPSADISCSFGEESGYFTSTPDYSFTSEINVEEDVTECMFNMSMEDISAVNAATKRMSTGVSYLPVPCNFSDTPPAGALRLRTYTNNNKIHIRSDQSTQSVLQRDVATQTGIGLLRQSLRARPASAPIYEEILDDMMVEDEDRMLDIVQDNGASIEWTLGDNRVGGGDDDVFRRSAEPLPDLLPRIRNRSISVPLFQNCETDRAVALSSSSRRIRVAAIQLRQLGDDFQLSRSPEQRSTAVFPLSFWRTTMRTSMSATCRLNEVTNIDNCIGRQSRCARLVTSEVVEQNHDSHRRRSLPSTSNSSLSSNSVSNVLDSVMQIFSRFGRHSTRTPSQGANQRTVRPRFFSENTTD